MSAMSFNVTSQSQTVDEYEAKDLILSLGILAAVGIVINIAAFSYVIYTPKIKRPLKVALFNLVGSDCMFLTGIFIGSFVKMNASTAPVVCPILTIMVLVPSPIAYSAVLGLAGYNFLAVYRATQFSEYVTPTRAIVITVIVWVVAVSPSVLSILITGQPDIQCSLTAQAPPAVLVIFAVYCICCSVGMVVLNIAVAVKLRSARSFSRGRNMNRILPQVGADDIFVQPDSLQVPKLLHVPTSTQKSELSSSGVFGVSGPTVALNLSQLAVSDKHVLVNHFQTKESDQISLQTKQTRFSQTTHDTGNDDSIRNKESCVTQTTNACNKDSIAAEKQLGEDTRNYFQPITDSETYSLPEKSFIKITGNSQNGIKPDIKKDNVLKNEVLASPNKPNLRNQPDTPRWNRKRIFFSWFLESKCSNKISCDGNHKNMNSTSEDHGQFRNFHHSSMPSMSSKMRTTIITLTILSFWNTGMTFPVLGMWLWMTTTDRVQRDVSSQWVYIALSVLATLNAVTNPLLYAWRFVEWRRLGAWLCRRHASVSIATASKTLESRQKTRVSH